MGAPNSDAPVYLLDSFAVLAYLKGEPSGERVRAILRQAEKGACRALLSVINLGEVAYIIEREKGLKRVQEILALIHHEPLEIIEVSLELTLKAAHIKANHPLSYADAFVVAAAQECLGTILTGDPEFHTVENLVKIEWLHAAL